MLNGSTQCCLRLFYTYLTTLYPSPFPLRTKGEEIEQQNKIRYRGGSFLPDLKDLPFKPNIKRQ